MKVGIIGSGGREHAICEILNNSNYLGSTVHVINEKFDLGQIIGQIKTKFSGLEYYYEITTKLKKNHVNFFYKSLINYLFKNKKLMLLKQILLTQMMVIK